MILKVEGNLLLVNGDEGHLLTFYEVLFTIMREKMFYILDFEDLLSTCIDIGSVMDWKYVENGLRIKIKMTKIIQGRGEINCPTAMEFLFKGDNEEGDLMGEVRVFVS